MPTVRCALGLTPFVCQDETVSGLHCTVVSDLLAVTPRVELEDTSTNGTFLDDIKLTKGVLVPLAAGAVIRLGARIRFRLQLCNESAEPAEPRTSHRQALQRLNPLRHDADDPVEDGDSEKVAIAVELPPPPMIVGTAQGKPAEVHGRSTAEGTAACKDEVEVSKPQGRSRLLVLPGHVPPLKRPRPSERIGG
ncbi:Chfr [Symbiodinium necroappetens]|uniref:Chfr protein n=1 Tax=Symbiodinium necroappetens TaxID=1628268 RepID=A0A812NIM6_9DINO|nr:Chfr [Symbiodinium necroappetens]